MESAKRELHPIFLACPGHSHLGALLKLAKLFHHKGGYITFVITEGIHKHLQITKEVPRFRFETIPDGLEEKREYNSENAMELLDSWSRNCLTPFRDLIVKLNNSASADDESPDFPPVSCVVFDSTMSFAIDAAEEVGIPAIAFWPFSATAVMCFHHFPHLFERGILPIKDKSDLKQTIDWIPGIKGMQLKHFSGIDVFMSVSNSSNKQVSWSKLKNRNPSAVLVNTFDALEFEVLKPLSSMIEHLYTIGPIHLLHKQIPKGENLASLDISLLEQDESYLKWLNSKETGSVIYVNFGSFATLTQDQLVELAWGLARSMQNFLWIIRPSLTIDGSDVLSPEFLAEIKGRGMLATSCNPEQVLHHPSVGAFLTHCGWNSIIESLSSGLPMMCWPYFADQPTNSFCCTKLWNVAVEIDRDVKREQVEKLAREMILGEKGKEMRKNALEWKNKAHISVTPGGSSYLNLDKLIEQLAKSYGKEVSA